MKNLLSLLTLILSVLLLNASTFTIPEHQQAIVLQLGKVTGAPITQAGLHFKLPFIQDVQYFEKRILQLDGNRGEVPTADKKFIWIDTTARWQITDALTFYKAVRDIPNALSRMGTVIDGITRDVVSSFNLIEMVRNSNAILQDMEQNQARTKEKAEFDPSDNTLDEFTSSVEKITTGREKISQSITTRAREELEQFGIHLIDVQLRSIAYKEVVEQKVYNRMISERLKIATKIRSAGFGEHQKIMGQLDLSLKTVESEAYRQSQEIKGKAEAQAIEIYANVLQEEPDFYRFMKTLETYKNTLGRNGNIILSTDSEFLQLLHSGGKILPKK